MLVFTAVLFFVMWVYPSLLYHSPNDGHLDVSKFFAVINRAAINSLGHMFFIFLLVYT